MQNVVQKSVSEKEGDGLNVEVGHATLGIAPSSPKLAEKAPISPPIPQQFITDLSASEEEEVSEVESFILDQEDPDDSDPGLDTSRFLLRSETEAGMEGTDLRSVDPETQARLEALLEAAGIGKLSTSDGKAFADPDVLRRLTSSVSCALDEAAAALTRMRAEQQGQNGQEGRSLAEACSDGDIGAVRKLLDEGRSVHETTEEGDSLLSLACSAGYYELAQVLLAMRANVEDRGIKGDCTPLMEAASGGFVDIVTLLIAHGADVNAQSSAGNTPLHYAACGGYADVVRVLIKAGANVEEHNENGHTPLMEAASAGHVGVAKILLESGAGINTHSNEFKESALTLACYKGHLEMVKFLLEAGADQEHKTDEMHTALMEASMDGHVEVARLLLDSGAQVNMPADSFESPLTLAACGGHVELANLLIERGANLEEVNDEGYTPLMEAAREGHEEMVALLLAHGADINAQTEETQETALTLACCGGFLEVSDFLIKAGADIELGCSTPLMEAAQEGHLDLVRYLLKSGANVHAQTGTGDTALTYACENGHTEVARVLLEHGANLEHESEGGRTPLMKAARAGHLCTVQFLISKGAGVNRTTSTNDHTVLSLACAGGHLPVVEHLLQNKGNPAHRLKDGSTMLIEAAKGGHTDVVNLLLDFPGSVFAPCPNNELAFTPADSHLNELPRVPMQGLNNVVPPQDPNCITTSCANMFMPNIPTSLPHSPGQVTLKDFNLAGKTTDQIRQNMQKSFARAKAKLTEADSQSKISVQSEGDTCSISSSYDYEKNYQDTGSPLSFDLDDQTDMKASERLEAFINKMMKKAELLNTTREEQILKKQQILEELQKVERELKEKAQAQFLLSAQQRPDQVQPFTPQLDDSIESEDLLLAQQIQKLQLNPMSAKNHQWSSPQVEALLAGIPDEQFDGCLKVVGTCVSQSTNSSTDSGITADVETKNKKNSLDQDMGSLPDMPDGESDTDLDQEELGLPSRTDGDGGEATSDGLAMTQQDEEYLQQDEEYLQQQGLMVAAPAMTLHETLGDIANMGAGLTQTTATIEASQKNLFGTLPQMGPVSNPPLPTINLVNTVGVQHPSLGQHHTAFSTQQINFTVPPQTNFTNLQPATTFNFQAPNLNIQQLNMVGSQQVGNMNLQQTPMITTQYTNTVTTSQTGVNSQHNYFTVQQQLKTQQQAQQILQQQLQQLKLQQEQQQVVQQQQRLQHQPQSPMTHDDMMTDLELDAFPAQRPSQTTSSQPMFPKKKKSKPKPQLQCGLQPTPPTNHLVSGMDPGLVPAALTMAATTPPQISPPVFHPAIDLDAETESNHDTALTLACAGGHAELVQLLLSRGADIEHRDKKGFTPLILAATAGHADVVEILLDHGADIEAQSERTKDTPLSLACSGGRIEVVELLLARGASKEHRNVSDYTPLSLAASGGYVNIIKLLLSHGAEINSRTGSKLGISPLMLAAMNGHTAAVKLLLDMGSDINAQIETNRNTALTLACFQGRHEVVSLLVDRKANIEHRAKTGLTPLMEAASGGYVEVGRVLLDKGADVNAPPVPSSRDTALTIAADKGHYRFVELLLSRGAAVDVKNKKGNSPLWLACNGGHLDVVQLLVSTGADIDSQDNRKVSCLMAAFRKGHVKVVKWMVKHVTQFPSDQECLRYIQTVTDKELLKKCRQCMDIIVSAKDRQAAEANKNATILLEELDLEKSREESKKAALARKREKKKKKKKEKQEKEREKEHEQSGNEKNSSPEPEKDDDEPEIVEMEETCDKVRIDTKRIENERMRESRLPMEPPSATTTSTIGTSLVTESRIKNMKKSSMLKEETTCVNSVEVELAKAKSRSKTRRSRTKDHSSLKEKDKPPDGVRVSTSNSLTTTTTTMSTSSSSSTSLSSSSSGSLRKKKRDIIMSTSTTGIGDLDDFGTLPATIKLSPKEERLVLSATEKKNKLNTLDTFDMHPQPVSPAKGSSSSKKALSMISSPVRGQKKEEGWKEVIRKSKKVTVPAAAITRVIGRNGCHINAIREVTGAHIEVDKQKGSGDKIVTIKGSADSTRQAHNLVASLIKDPDMELTEILPKTKNRPQPVGVSSSSSLQAQVPIGVFMMPVTTPQNGQVPSSHMNSLISIQSTTIHSVVQSSTVTQKTTLVTAGGTPVITQAWKATSSKRKMSSSSISTNINPVPSSATMIVPGSKSPSTVSRQLFPDKKGVHIVTTTTVKSIGTFTSASSSSKTRMVNHTPPAVSLKSDVNKSLNFTGKQHAMSGKVDHQPLPIKSTPGQAMHGVPPTMSSSGANTPGEYSPFNSNLFSHVKDEVLGKKGDYQGENRMNFASVAAAGVVPPTGSTPPPPPETDPNLQAKAPGFGMPRPSSPSSQRNEADLAKAPGYKGPMHGPPAVTTAFTSPSVLTNLTSTISSQGSIPSATLLQTAVNSMAHYSVPPISSMRSSAMDVDFAKMAGLRSGMQSSQSLSPRSGSSTPGAPSPRTFGSMGMGMGLPMGIGMGMGMGMEYPPSSLTPGSLRDEYSTPHQPMTLPKISSTLNPNAPDFAPDFTMRFFKPGMPAFMQGAGPGPMHQAGFGGTPPGAPPQGTFPHNFGPDFNPAAMMSGFSQSGSFPQAPGPSSRPSQFSPLPPGNRSACTTPSVGTSSRDGNSPNPQQSAETSPLPSSSPSPTDHLKGDDRNRSLRPIGGERALKKPTGPAGLFKGGRADSEIWMSNMGDINTDWMTTASVGAPSPDEDSPGSQSGNPPSFMETGSSELSAEQSLQNQPGMMMQGGQTGFNNFANGVPPNPMSNMFPNTSGAGDGQVWNPQVWNTSNWNQQPPAM
ncbi:ankyrin repeat domain-containing protein 17-like isoform X2 [Lineus longissimus]|uniref:ankyrin repeat domain-containing protein 17-like isoform X2 n=1 Tax=Lineus longissimus TaxID=88925 RepID=UPI002B4F9449